MGSSFGRTVPAGVLPQTRKSCNASHWTALVPDPPARVPFEHAMAMIGAGEIQDAKTILLLQHAKLHGLFD